MLTTGSHRHSYVFGAMSIDGMQLFRQRSSIDGENFLAYLKELKRKFAPMLLFLDRSGPHYRDGEVRKFLMENSDCIEVIWFPRARPELNPVEECWRQSKDIVLANRVYPSFDEMKRRISRILRTRRFKLNIVEYLC